LKPHGIIEICVPDIEVICNEFKDETRANLIFGEPLFAGIDTGNYGMHKWGFTQESLFTLFIMNNVEVIEIKNVDGTNIYCKGRKMML
jgi:hypothetical protein